jgi:hypothetical protein
MIGNSGKQAGELGLRIDVVELGGGDRGVHGGGALATAVGAGEQPMSGARGRYRAALVRQHC